MKLHDLAALIGAELTSGDAAARELEIDGVHTVERAGPRHVTFLTNPRFRKQLDQTRAAAVIVGAKIEELALPQLVTRNPYAAMAKASAAFHQVRHAFHGQSELAFVHPEAKVDASATIFPFAYVERGAEIGRGVVLYPHVFVGEGARIGEDSVVYPGAVLMNRCVLGARALVNPGAVIGGEGFGFAPTREGIEKIPQIGAVQLGEDCEVGSNTTIDRGAFEDTNLGRGVKLDSNVQIGHGVQLGEWSMVCGLAGIAGSAKVGKRYIGAGLSGVAPGVELPDNTVLGAMGGMISSQKEGGEYLGMPAVPSADWRRQMVALGRLPDLLKTVRALSARIDELENAKG